jgi:hypothetical protein
MFPFLDKAGEEHPEELGLALAYVIAPQLIKGGSSTAVINYGQKKKN